MGHNLPADERGTSESAGVAVLVLFTVLVTASVGIGVLFVDQDADEGPEAEFSYDYFGERRALLVTFESGDEFRAGNVVVTGPAMNKTWNEIGPLNESSTLEPGSRVLLNANNEYGQSIREFQTIKMVRVQGDNETVLSTWTGSSE
jgi:hypothetical protein